MFLYDLAEGLAVKGLAGISGRLRKMVEKGKLTQESCSITLGHLCVAGDLNQASDCDLVLEAIIESMEAKTVLFQELDRICKPETIFATNTSSLSVTQIASATKRPNQVIGMHFSNPAPVMKFMEIIKLLCDAETDQTVATLGTAG